MDNSSNQRWTVEDDEVVRQRWAIEHTGFLARDLGRSLTSVEHRAKKLGLMRAKS